MLLDTGTVIDDRREVYGVVVIGYQTLLLFHHDRDRVDFVFSSDIEKTYRRHKEDICVSDI